MVNRQQVNIRKAYELQSQGRFREATDEVMAQASRAGTSAEFYALAEMIMIFADQYIQSKGNDLSPYFTRRGRYPFLLNLALQYYKQVVALDETHFDAAFSASKTATKLDMPASAFDYARIALEIKPESTDAWQHLAELHRQHDEFLEMNACLGNISAIRDKAPEAINKGVLGDKKRKTVYRLS